MELGPVIPWRNRFNYLRPKPKISPSGIWDFYQRGKREEERGLEKKVEVKDMSPKETEKEKTDEIKNN